MEVSKGLIRLAKEFKKNKHTLYIVGGFVRDSLLGHNSKDIDIASNYGYVGGLVGTCAGKAENCLVKGSVSVGSSIKLGADTCYAIVAIKDIADSAG